MNLFFPRRYVMCGIAGWIGGSFRSGGDVSAHRPIPSASRSWRQGIYLKRDVCLVHTRFNILDLSSTGARPMVNEDGIVWTIFNSEIYNYHDLRRDLEARGR
jgi:asparagine synthase (glutamine-hydrolysing)